MARAKTAEDLTNTPEEAAAEAATGNESRANGGNASQMNDAQAQQLAAAGFDLGTLLKLLQLAPEALALIKRVIELLNNPQPAPVYAAGDHTDQHALLDSALQSAICAAHCIARVQGHKH